MQEVSRNLTLLKHFWKSETLTQIHQTRPVSQSIQPDYQSQRSSIILTTDLAQLVHLSQSINPSGPTSPFNLQSVISLSFHQICPSFLPEGSSTSITRTTLPHRKWMIHSGKQLPEFQWKMISLPMKQSFPNLDRPDGWSGHLNSPSLRWHLQLPHEGSITNVPTQFFQLW